jgi:hypothetical protein
MMLASTDATAARILHARGEGDLLSGRIPHGLPFTLDLHLAGGAPSEMPVAASPIPGV